MHPAQEVLSQGCSDRSVRVATIVTTTIEFAKLPSEVVSSEASSGLSPFTI